MGRVCCWGYWTEPLRAGMGGGVPRVPGTITDWALFVASDSWGGFIFGGSLEGGDVEGTDGLRAGTAGNFCWVGGWTASDFTGTGWPACFNGTWIGFACVGGDWFGLLTIVCNFGIGCCGKCCVCATFGVWWWCDGAACICLCCMCGDFLLSDPAAT